MFLLMCSSDWVGCFGGGGRQWEKIPEVNGKMLREEKKKEEQITDNKLLSNFFFFSFSISLGGRESRGGFLRLDRRKRRGRREVKYQSRVYSSILCLLKKNAGGFPVSI